jgi:hypothetical protein
MSQNIYCSPSLVIGGNEISHDFRANVDFRGNNTINSAKIIINSDRMNHTKLFGKEVAIYLNQGSIDNVPIFRGFIQSVQPDESSLSLQAKDGRCFLTGENSPDVDTTTGEFYGNTLSQFTYAWINDVINIDKVVIGLGMLNETSPSQPLFTDSPLSVVAKAYDIIKKGISLNRSNEGKQFKKYEIVMIDDGNKSNIHFLKDKDLDGPAACIFSDVDGIIKLSYKKEPLPTYVMIGKKRYQIGSQPNGPHILKSDYLPPLENYISTPAEIQDMVISQLEMHRVWNEKLITLTASKGHYLNIGDIVFLDVDDEEINGKHKITSKRFIIGGSNMNIKFTLSKRIQSFAELI